LRQDVADYVAFESGKPIVTEADTPASSCGGAPRGNRNRIASGVQSFVLGRYPKGGAYIARSIRWLRRQLRDAVGRQDGQTTIWSEAVIASACQHEGRRLLLLRWLRIEGDGLPVLDRAALLDRIGTSTDARDRCLKLLRLDVKPDADPWADTPALPAPATNSSPDDQTAIQTDWHASDDRSSSGSGQ
jgi:hypothetical protein